MFSRSLFMKRAARNVILSRGMAGGHHKEYVPTGKIDALIRGVFKEEYQLSMGIFGFYTIIILYATSGKKKEAVAPVAIVEKHHTPSDSAEIPSADSPDFGDWLSGEGNFEKLITGAAN